MQFNVRLSAADLAILTSAAKSLGVSKSDLVRLLARLQVRNHSLAAPKDTPSFIILDTSAIPNLARENIRQGQVLTDLTAHISNLAYNRREVSASDLNALRRELSRLTRAYEELFLAIQDLRASAHDYL